MWGARGLEGWGDNWSPLAVPVVRTHTCAHVPQPGNELLWILLRKGPGFIKCLRAWSSVSPKNLAISLGKRATLHGLLVRTDTAH